MEDVTDTVFRQIVISCGRPDVFFTEFTNTDGLLSKGREKVIKRFQYTRDERPLIAQIWGNVPEHYYEVAKQIGELGFDGIDINMGCPVNKVVGRGQCSGLISQPNLAVELIKAAQEGAGELPVSVKTRIGTNRVMTEEWFPVLLAQNLDALTVHGRTAKQKSLVPNDWSEIAKVVKLRDQINPRTVIIGNGDLKSVAEIYDKHSVYGVDGGMIGRGIFANPYLFSGQSLHDKTILERLELLLRHVRLFDDTWGREKNFAVLKRYFKIYVSDFEGAAELRDQLMHTNNRAEVEEVIAGYTN